MKICVYALCKNESKFISRWYESMKEADEIYVLDTGSTDNSLELLKELGVNVERKIITPWRFDVARNASLQMVPKDTDVCICTDMDEVFEKGWRENVEKYWTKDATRAKYNYNWNFDENDRPVVNYYIEKMHTRKNYKWTHPVHEILTYTGKKEENIITIPNITLNHYPDNTKSRSSYLPLLELSVSENPEDDRNVHYLGREYMYYGKWDEAIKTLKKHLKLKTATWKDERAASMRFISRCYKNQGKITEARKWLNKACDEAPYLRDAYMERAILEYEQKDYKAVEKYCLKALEIKKHAKTYINEVFSWNETVYDLLSISCYMLKKYRYANYFIDLALEINPNDERLITNKIIIKKEIE